MLNGLDSRSQLTLEADREGNPVQFLKAFDRSMAGYRTLEADVTALLSRAEVQSSIEVLSDEGNGATRMVELDWFLQIVEQQDAAGSTRRRAWGNST